MEECGKVLLMTISKEQVRTLARHVEQQVLTAAEERRCLSGELRERGSFAGMVGLPALSAEGLMTCAQARWVLNDDLEGARACLAIIPSLTSSLVPAINDIRAALAGKIAWDGFKLEYFLLFSPLIGLILAGAHDELVQLCQTISAHTDAFLPQSRKHVVGEFVAQLADVGAGNDERVSLAAFERAEQFSPKHFTYGYHEMLYYVGRREEKEFERVRAEREAAFPERSRSREVCNQLNVWGLGKMAQTATFDALGVALCRLATWRDISVNVNSRLYPREFYA